MDEMNNDDEKASWLVGLLTGWGIRKSWAKLLAGAILGAVSAFGTLGVLN